MFVGIHILQTFPASNLDSDDNGTPKTLVYGGCQRGLVSSQSWKRATRTQLEQLVPAAKSYRSRKMPDRRFAEILGSPEYGVLDAKWANAIAIGVFRALGTKKGKAVDAIFSEQDLQALAPVAMEHADDLVMLAESEDADKIDAVLKKALTAVTSVARPTTAALFGSTIADDISVNVDGAMQIDDAFSIDEVVIEVDSFTAEEELVAAQVSKGATPMDTAELISGTFYRYATLDFDELVANCGGDRVLASELAAAGIKSFCLSLPSGENDTTAPHTVPDLITLTVSQHRPVSLAGAFEKPVKARHRDISIEGAKVLSDYSRRILRNVAGTDEPFGVVSVLDADAVAGLGKIYDETGGLDALISAAVATVRGA